MSKMVVGIIVGAIAIILVIIYGLQSIPPKIEQPSEELINSPQPIE